MNTLVKVEFGERTLGESPKVECSPETPAEFNYNTTINVTFEDAHSLIEIANKPVCCTYTCMISRVLQYIAIAAISM